MNKFLLIAAALIGLLGPANAASTINPNSPPQSGPLTSGPVRNNFVAAYNDINNILGVYAGKTAPPAPVNFQSWANTNTIPVVVFNYYNAANAVWVPYATLNVNTNVYTPFSSTTGALATPPITVSVSGGVATYGLAIDTNFAVVSNKLGFASTPAWAMLANCSVSSAEPTQCTWNNFAAGAIGNTDGMIPYHLGGAWGTATTGTTGHAIPFLDALNNWSAVQTLYTGTSTLQATLAGTLWRIANVDGSASLYEADAYGASGGFTCVRASGTAAAKLALAANDEICHMASHGYDGTAFSTITAGFRIYASQPWTTTAHGSYARIGVTPNGATVITDIIGFENDGGITVPPTVTGGSKGAGSINVSGGVFAGSLAIAGCSMPGGSVICANGNITSNNGVFSPSIFGGSAANSTLTLQSTSSSSTSGDTTNVFGSTVTIGSSQVVGSIINLAGPNGGGVTVNIGAANNGLNSLNVFNNVGGKQIWVPGAPATITFPGATTTLMGRDTTDIETNKTFDTAGAGNVFKINGTPINTLCPSACIYAGNNGNATITSNFLYNPEVPITFSATPTIDFSTFINASIAMTGNITTMNVANVTAGKAGTIVFTQDATGSRTTVWNSVFKFAGGVTPTLSTTANAVDILSYSCRSATFCVASLLPNVK